MWYGSSLILRNLSEWAPGTETLGWEPPTSLEDGGMRLMGQWIRQEVEMTLEGYQDGNAVLRDLQPT